MKFIYYFIILIPSLTFGQNLLTGKVYEKNQNNTSIPIQSANIYWLNTNIGTITDSEGQFKIPYQKKHTKLVISYIGYKTDTLTINTPKYLRHELFSNNDLDAVSISTQKKSTQKSYLSATNILNISSDELLKAACCNLSESFETNPSIDVNFTDAVSGTRQIKLLGLTSPYILIATENIPSIRGASQAYGLSFIPGTWVESIQLTKGAGSVINGFESFSGQINVELQKPRANEKLFINAYASGAGRYELNTHINHNINPHWDTGFYIHGNLRSQEFDKNNDSFLDVPLAKQINILNRWQYTNAKKGLVSFMNLRYLNDEKQSGQIQFNPNTQTQLWQSDINTERIEFSGKLGYVNPEITYQTMGLQLSYSHHNQNSVFGLRDYNIIQNSIYSNLIYNTIISDTRHKIKTGITFTYDDYNELVETTKYSRTERSIGGFAEYHYDNLDNLNLTLGARIDTNNLLGTFITPRLHLRYTPWGKAAIKASVGRSKRSANIFAENQKYFASSRTLNILNSEGNIYGLDPEIAWNYGLSFLQGFQLFNRNADVAIDLYRTDFNNQVVVDAENPIELNFYNLNGQSYANSLQLELNFKPLKRIDVRVAYKYYDVKTQYQSGIQQAPLTPSQRFFSNIAYETVLKNNKQWKFDITLNWLNQQRLPNTNLSPLQFQKPNLTPTVTTLNAQITKVFSKNFEIYIGGENITNLKQNNPIINPDNAFGSNFDTTFVYGPIFGSMYYTGLRFKIK